MISVLTLTYKRHHLLEEAIQSFLSQENTPECEMVIINDNSEVDYIFDHPLVRVINHKERFQSLSDKIKWGYKQCKYDFIYRLDDDDLLAPRALEIVANSIYSGTRNNNTLFEIYRSKNHYFFSNNVYEGRADNINNGNIYSKKYLDRITFPDTSFGEDANITCAHNALTYTMEKATMIYRWGMNTLHISGMGNQTNERILAEADKVLDNTTGKIILNPHFKNDYYSQII